VLARHLMLVALCFFTIQTLARHHHLPFDHATNWVNAASLFFSFGYVKKQKQKKEKKEEKEEKEKEKKEKG
jgi:hypothetical protein